MTVLSVFRAILDLFQDLITKVNVTCANDV